MATKKPVKGQITNRNFLQPTGFTFQVNRAPKLAYFGSSVNLPALNFPEAQMNTYLKHIPLPGTVMDFEDLTIRFLVDENLENFREIHGWMTGLAFPEDHSEYQTLLNAGQDRFPTTVGTQSKTDPGKVSAPTPMGAAFSDATLHILTSKNNANIEARFANVFPKALSGLQFSTQIADVEYLTASVTFGYKNYTFANKNASRTTVTTT